MGNGRGFGSGGPGSEAGPGFTPGDRWEFLIAGAGPAGCRAAELLAARGASVLLLDPRVPWEKPCGGGLTAAALRNTPALRELEGHGVMVRELLVIAPSGASVLVPVRDPYLVVSRRRLSSWGLERARKAGARFLRRAVRSAVREDGVWRIVDVGGTVHRARWLIAADGATSRLRGHLAPGLRPELAPLRVTYPRRGVQTGRAVFLFVAATAGYLWDFPRPDHHSVGIGVPPGTFGREALDDAIDQYLLAEAGDPSPRERRGAVIATSLWRAGDFQDLGGRNYALLGDAAGLADPATGEGIDYALRSATLAVETFEPAAGFEAYPAAAEAAFGAEMRRARLLRNWLYRPRVAEGLVRWAGRSEFGAYVLSSLVDAVNEHRSLRAALFRGLISRPGRRPAADVCICAGDDTARGRERSRGGRATAAGGERAAANRPGAAGPARALSERG